jgi:hypothetical protein
MNLQYLDIAIAVSVVMLAVSLFITILSQLVANLLSLRGTNLRWAVTTLIGEVHPAVAPQARTIANIVLTHPLISDSTLSRFSKTPVIGWFAHRMSLASAVRIEELVGVMDLIGDPALPLATPGGAMAAIATTAKAQMGPQLQAATKQATEVVGALAALPAGPAGALAGSVHVDQLLARVPGAAEAVLGTDIKSWFNSTMDRAAQRFTLHMRVVTLALSIMMAIGIHLDAFQLVADLSASPELRASLVGQADTLKQLAQTPSMAPADVDKLLDRAAQVRRSLDQTRFRLIPDPYPDLRKSLQWPLQEWFGIVFSAGLLGLGAPFWYSALKSMTALRPILASKQQQESATVSS